MQDDHSVSHFIKYNNAVPIILGALFLSTSATLAASPEMRDSVYSSAAEIKNIDNSYLLSANLGEYDFSMRVKNVSEDADWYYLAYELRTIDVVDGAWQPVTYEKELRVSKALLRGGDLRTYVEVELAQVRDQEQRLLSEAKERESKRGMTQKTVATVYGGLVGSLIEPSEETLPFFLPPAGEQEKNDPLRVKKPQALVTWDENAKQGVTKTSNDGASQGAEPTDYCPGMSGVQEHPGLCPTNGQPPVVNLPVVEPPAEEEPPVEDPAPAEPVVEPEPEPNPEPVAPTPEPEQGSTTESGETP